MKQSVILNWAYLLIPVFVLSACNVETPEVAIIPCPRNIELQKGVFRLSEKSTIYFDPAFENEAQMLQQILADEFGLSIQTRAAGSSTVPSGHIYLSAGSSWNRKYEQ